MGTYCKLAREDGWDFFTADTINYRAAAEAEGKDKIVKVPHPDESRGLCSSGIIHAALNPNDCFPGAEIPCSAYKVAGKPVCDDGKKYGFFELEVMEEIHDLDTLFGWDYTQIAPAVIPLQLQEPKITDEEIELLKQWSLLWRSVYTSIPALIPIWLWYWVGAVMAPPLGDPVAKAVFEVAYTSHTSILGTVAAAMWAFMGSLFPGIRADGYAFQPVVDLWKRGIIASFDGEIWRLHTGRKAEIVWEGTC